MEIVVKDSFKFSEDQVINMVECKDLTTISPYGTSFDVFSTGDNDGDDDDKPDYLNIQV